MPSPSTRLPLAQPRGAKNRRQDALMHNYKLMQPSVDEKTTCQIRTIIVDRTTKTHFSTVVNEYEVWSDHLLFQLRLRSYSVRIIKKNSSLFLHTYTLPSEFLKTLPGISVFTFERFGAVAPLSGQHATGGSNLVTDRHSNSNKYSNHSVSSIISAGCQCLN